MMFFLLANMNQLAYCTDNTPAMPLPLWYAHFGRFFLRPEDLGMTFFNKPSLSIDEHLNQWSSWGLVIPDLTRARRYLTVISYYRLSAYILPFQLGDPEHHFRAGTTFESVLDLYIFDRRLRLLILDAIERLEVALRARMTDVLAENHGSHAYFKKDIF